MEPTLLLIVAVALFFDYSNGFHDAANSIATIVSTRVLSPRAAVIWAAFFNFIAFAVFGVHVAKTIAKGTVQQFKVNGTYSDNTIQDLTEAAGWQEVVRTQFYNGVPVQMTVKEYVETEEHRRAKAALADLEEEFRRTGLPPGWTR